jgi:hypothetical protein
VLVLIVDSLDVHIHIVSALKSMPGTILTRRSFSYVRRIQLVFFFNFQRCHDR